MTACSRCFCLKDRYLCPSDNLGLESSSVESRDASLHCQRQAQRRGGIPAASDLGRASRDTKD